MNLFENLQNLKEASKLEERTELSVSEYNRLKIALNKNNSMRNNFIIHPGKLDGEGFKLRLYIYGAFKNREHATNSYHSWAGKYKNDEVTRDGVGTELYSIYINLIDESVSFSDITTYSIRRYVEYYKSFLISNNIVQDNEMDIESLIKSIVDIANTSKNDAEKLLLSKNFIYNLTGKKKTQYKDSPEYNLNLENTKLMEDFDSSMPNWLMRGIKMYNDKRTSGHKDLNYIMPLDSMKWVVEPFPEKGKMGEIGDNEYIALLVDKSGDNHLGNYIVYFPAAHIGIDETIEINGRNRRIDSMSLKALAPYVKEYAHTIGGETSIQDVRQKRLDRQNTMSGSIDRIRDEDRYEHAYADKFDKSGYIVDPNKYKRLLAQLKHEDYANRLNDLFIVLSDVRNKFKEFMSKDSMIPEPGSGYGRGRQFDSANKAFRFYDSALDYYNNAVKTLEKIKDGKTDGWYGESFTSFNNHLANAEVKIVECLKILEAE